MLESLRSSCRRILAGREPALAATSSKRVRPSNAAFYGMASLLAAAMATGIANAQPGPANDSCKMRLDSLVAEWRSIAVPGTPAESESARHSHTALEVWYMRSQLRLARRSCEEGDEHEAMLRMDVVRAWLRLPEVSHPADHRYRYDEPGSK